MLSDKYRYLSYTDFLACDVSDPDYMDGDWYELSNGSNVWIYNFKWWFIQQDLNNNRSCMCKENFNERLTT